MDGWPSAPDSDPESPELTERSSRPSDIERELDALRARAYGPEADIDADPSAMARLVELEAAHRAATAARAAAPVAVATAVTATAPGEEPTAPSSRDGGSRGVRGRRTWAVVAVICLFAIVAATVWNLVLRPDATLRQIDADGGSDVIRVLSAQGRGPDASTLRQFEPYHDVGVWSVENAAGKVCFVVWDRLASGRFSIKCAPPGREVALSLTVESEGVDDFAPWLPDGSIVDFHLRDDTVDVFVRPPAD
ncbi:hypothetical protein ACEYYH_01340 [Microbacterium trichothecenolyticum]|uniref:hypothetical protein n=1 Tax=Microbacterium trichothecenolyticum TaxID=69370 RepID=UPI0035BE500C